MAEPLIRTECDCRNLARASRRSPARRHDGFTLIEVMIVVTIVAILASIALPAYTEYVRKGRRAEAQSFLADVVARQQHFLLDRRAYATSITNSPAGGGLGLAIPANVATFYSVTIATSNSAPPSFTITATPQGAQASEACGALSITNAGSKSAAKTGCW
jgi:type IV pilus assembly protein PilE